MNLLTIGFDTEMNRVFFRLADRTIGGRLAIHAAILRQAGVKQFVGAFVLTEGGDDLLNLGRRFIIDPDINRQSLTMI